MPWLLAEVTGVVEGTTTSVFDLRPFTLVMTLVLSRLSFALALALTLSFAATFPPLVNNDELLPLLLPPLPFEGCSL
jgi:hypothetical protein